MIDDPWTLKLEGLLLEIAREAQREHKKYYVGGGFAIDLSIGKITRPHEDLDFYPMESDTDFWKNWFKKKGFIISKDPDMLDYPKSFLPTNEQKDYFSDVYPVTIGENGEISMLYKDGSQKVWEGKSWNEVQLVKYKGAPVFIENPETVLSQKLEYIKEHGGELSDKHKHDFKILGRYRICRACAR